MKDYRKDSVLTKWAIEALENHRIRIQDFLDRIDSDWMLQQTKVKISFSNDHYIVSDFASVEILAEIVMTE